MDTGYKPSIAEISLEAQLKEACWKHDLQTVSNLLSRGGANASIPVDGNDGWSVLHMVAKHNMFDAMEIILSSPMCGAAVDPRTPSWKTPFMLACRSGNLDCAKLLVQKGANTDTKDVYGDTILCSAVKSGILDMVIACLSWVPFQINAHGRFCKTPLLYACERNFLEIIRLLVREGADMNMRDDNGVCALKYATMNPEIRRIFEEVSGKLSDNIVPGQQWSLHELRRSLSCPPSTISKHKRNKKVDYAVFDSENEALDKPPIIGENSLDDSVESLSGISEHSGADEKNDRRTSIEVGIDAAELNRIVQNEDVTGKLIIGPHKKDFPTSTNNNHPRTSNYNTKFDSTYLLRQFNEHYNELIPWMEEMILDINNDTMGTIVEEARLLLEKHKRRKVEIERKGMDFAFADQFGHSLLSIHKHDIEKQLSTLTSRKRFLMEFWGDQNILYEQSYDFKVFTRDVESEENWIQTQQNILTKEIPINSLDSIEKLIKELKDVEDLLHEQNIKAISDIAARLIEGNHYAAEDIQRRMIQITETSLNLHKATEDRRVLLVHTQKLNSFNKKHDEIKSRILETMSAASTEIQSNYANPYLGTEVQRKSEEELAIIKSEIQILSNEARVLLLESKNSSETKDVNTKMENMYSLRNDLDYIVKAKGLIMLETLRAHILRTTENDTWIPAEIRDDVNNDQDIELRENEEFFSPRTQISASDTIAPQHNNANTNSLNTTTETSQIEQSKSQLNIAEEITNVSGTVNNNTNGPIISCGETVPIVTNNNVGNSHIVEASTSNECSNRQHIDIQNITKQWISRSLDKKFGTSSTK